jgi:hypothetical protein
MEYAVKMGSGAMIKDWFRHAKFEGGYTDTQTAW